MNPRLEEGLEELEALEQLEETKQTGGRSPAEWLGFGIAVTILGGIVSLVGYLWISEDTQAPPQITVSRTEGIRQEPGQFYVPFTVTNRGGETAASVQVVAELRQNGEVVEAGEQLIDYLSRGEVEEGAFIFTQNPAEGELVLRVASYTLP
ncbi:MAG: TIGR02588 family protein [Synechococcales bacterium]|nr:TIGR02588 family protein [Synechococcales bacterium]